MKKQKGFSLIELLIVVAIILIIAAIAVPNLLRSRMAANESSAAGSERTLATSNVTYATTYGIGFAGSLAHLGCPTAGCATSGAVSSEADLIDSTLASGTKNGYDFTYVAGPTGGTPVRTAPNNSYSAAANPDTPNVTGRSTFCVDQSNIVRKDPAGTAITAVSSGCATSVPVL
jgi:prepilin-type N-terminal cleavage/methylation domain-containing protein